MQTSRTASYGAVGIAVAVLVALIAPRVEAQSSAEVALAESLFREGHRLFKAGDYARACPKFAESMRLDPGGGTILNLARCHDAEGKVASAWAEYQEALAWAERDQRKDRVRIARQRIAALEPRLSYVTIKIAKDAMVPGLEVTMDNTTLGTAALETPTPVDPGEHVVEVRAPNKAPRLTKFRVTGDKELHTIVIRPLKDAPPAPPESNAPAPSSLGDTIDPHDPTIVSLELPSPEAPHRSPRLTAAYVAGGVGIAALWVGGGFGIRAIRKMNASDQECPSGHCTEEGAELSRQANRSANVANIGLGLGVVALGVGGYLLFTEPQRAENPQAIRRDPRKRVEPRIHLEPSATPHSIHLGVRRSF